MSLVPVILCGGSGTRLFPLSRASRPKQLLQLIGDKSLLQQTVMRVSAAGQFGAPIIICNAEYRFSVAEQLAEIGIKPRAIVLEPVGRNTAPAVAVAAELALSDNPESRLLILPSDHAIANTPAFLEAVSAAEALALSRDALVTFGITPTGPETGYGYIEVGDELGGSCFSVARFTEKPDLATATQFLEGGRHVWNSGMFLFSAARILAELEKFESELLSSVRDAVANADKDLDFMRLEAAAFGTARNISVDHAVMERTSDAATVRVDMGWSDIGSWSALWEISKKDEHGNAALGDVMLRDSHNCYVRADHGLVATVGVKDLVVITTPDVTLVAHRDQAQNVGKLVEQLKLKGRAEPHAARRMHRPWGWYEGIAHGARFQVKQILVHPGRRLSLQKHYHRAEHWIVAQGTAIVTIDDRKVLVKENESAYIPLGAVHRLENPGHIPLLLIEVQSGAYLGEDDIVRLEDDYRRTAEPGAKAQAAE